MRIFSYIFIVFSLSIISSCGVEYSPSTLVQHPSEVSSGSGGDIHSVVVQTTPLMPQNMRTWQLTKNTSQSERTITCPNNSQKALTESYFTLEVEGSQLPVGPLLLAPAHKRSSIEVLENTEGADLAYYYVETCEGQEVVIFQYKDVEKTIEPVLFEGKNGTTRTQVPVSVPLLPRGKYIFLQYKSSENSPLSQTFWKYDKTRGRFLEQ